MGALRRWLPLLAVIGLLTAAAFAASVVELPLTQADQKQTQQEEFVHPAEPEPDAADPQQLAEPQPSGELPPWLTTALLLVVVAAVAIVLARPLAAALRKGTRFRRRVVRERPKPKPVAEEEIVAALDAGLLDLDDADIDPRRAVIACWVRLEQTAAAVGVLRQPGDTSTDLVVRLLTGHALNGDLLAGFADLYRRARYATHQVDEQMREQARAALHRLRSELAGVPV